MTSWALIDLSVFAIVLTITGLIIPQILLIAFRRNLFDEVDSRKIHKGTVPRLGGIAFFPAILFGILLIAGVSSLSETLPALPHLTENFREFSMVSCGVITLYLVGLSDDLIGVRYIAKFGAQIIAAIFLIIGGIYFNNFHGFLGIADLPYPIIVILTLLLTIFITNAFNLIDGIDGLASGLSAIACIFYGIVFFNQGLYFFSMLSFATLGALVPFFCYNVFGNSEKHHKIFMGDTGSLTIGLILSVLSLRICMETSLDNGVNPAVAAFSPLLIPCLDVVRVYFRRIRHHINPFLPDKTHIHHKLLDLGMTQRQAMPLLIFSAILLVGFNYWVSEIMNITLLFVIDLVIWTLANILLSRRITRSS